MKLSIALILAGLATVASVDASQKRPIVCLEFTETTMPVEGTPTKVAVCTDRKKPVILTSYTVQTVKDADGKSVKAAIGYR
jgi:hypothetical protein